MSEQQNTQHIPIINVLMTGAGAPGAAGILQCLWQDPSLQITVADANEHAVGRYLAHDFEKIPVADDAHFVENLLAICRKRNIHVLLPLVTRELNPLSLNLKSFEAAGTKVLVSSAQSIAIANNKGHLYDFLKSKGIEVPDYRIINDINSFKTAAKDLGAPGNAICFKPVFSNGSRGFRIIDSSVNELDLLISQKPNTVYIKYEEAIRLLSSGAFPELLVTEYLPGKEYSVDCLAKHGESILVIPRLRRKMINGISVEGEFVFDEKIISYCQSIIKALTLHGNIGIQVKESANGKFLLLEINPRVQGTVSACLGAGINLPLLAIKQELGLPILPEELQPRWGTRFSRYWREVFY